MLAFRTHPGRLPATYIAKGAAYGLLPAMALALCLQSQLACADDDSCTGLLALLNYVTPITAAAAGSVVGSFFGYQWSQNKAPTGPDALLIAGGKTVSIAEAQPQLPINGMG